MKHISKFELNSINEGLSNIIGGSSVSTGGSTMKEGPTVPHSGYPDGDTGVESQSCGCVERDAPASK